MSAGRGLGSLSAGWLICRRSALSSWSVARPGCAARPGARRSPPESPAAAGCYPKTRQSHGRPPGSLELSPFSVAERLEMATVHPRPPRTSPAAASAPARARARSHAVRTFACSPPAEPGMPPVWRVRQLVFRLAYRSDASVRTSTMSQASVAPFHHAGSDRRTGRTPSGLSSDRRSVATQRHRRA